MEMNGKQILGRSLSAEGTVFFQVESPVTGENLPGYFYHATDAEIERAASLAESFLVCS